MPKIMHGGKNFSGWSVNDIYNISENGLFLDESNVIQETVTVSSEIDYTATEDCAIQIVYSGSSSAQSSVLVNDVRLLGMGGVNATLAGLLFLKKGDVLTFTPAGSWNNYTVYGLKQGIIGNAQIEYSTDEQVIGTWIDGKTLYEKTYTWSGSLSNNNYVVLDADLKPTNYLVHNQTLMFKISGANNRFISNALPNSYTLCIGSNEGDGLYAENRTGQIITDIVTTVRYTKTTD